MLRDYFVDNSGGAAIRWNGKNGDTGYGVEIINGTTFTSSGCYSGFVGTLDLLVDSSTLNVVDHKGNGSNGSNYTIVNSAVNFNNNGSHGLSTTTLSITDSTVNANGNGMCGIITSGATTITHSTVNIQENKVNVAHQSQWSRPGALTLKGKGTISADSNVTITDNAGSGIYLWTENASLEMQSGVVMNNHATRTAGGGIYNEGTCTISDAVQLYNNHSDIAGDDIYNAEVEWNYTKEADGTVTWYTKDITPEFNFAATKPDWVLSDCDHYIDGWYDDGDTITGHADDMSTTPRWNADEDEVENYIVKYEQTQISGMEALKAAHGEDPVDKTSYPGMDKTIVTDDGKNVDSGTSAAGETVDFELETNVPDDLLNYIIPDVDKPQVVTPATNALVPVDQRGTYEITIHDDMDAAFVDPTTPVVTLDRTEGEDVTLASDQYTYTSNPGDGCDFHIVIDLVALYDKGIITDTDIENATSIKVTYTATLAEGTTAGDYHNTAWVVYPEGESGKDIVTVETFKINIFKYDQANPEKGLEGAKFELYQKDAEGNIIEDSVIKLTSDTNGSAVADGLDAGTYYLKETEAPEGYVCSNKVVTIEIPGDDVGADNIVNVKFANSLIPHTGGMGTTLFSIVGGALIATAGVVFFVSRRKKSRTA